MLSLAKMTLVTAASTAVLILAGCQNSHALGAARSGSNGSVVVTGGGVTGSAGDLDLNDRRDGYALGRRNGEILVDRLSKATVGREGCAGIGHLQQALVSVASRIRTPLGTSTALSAGFIDGYLDAIRAGVRDLRHACSIDAFDDRGEFAGALAGGAICSAVSVSLDVATSLEARSLYEGWSGGLEENVAGCVTQIDLELSQCVEDDVSRAALSLAVERSCAH